MRITERTSSTIEELERQVADIFNNGIVFEDNVHGGFVTITLSSSLNEEKEIVHGLGHIPVGYIVLQQSAAGHVFKGSTAWTDEKLYLVSDVKNLEVRLFVM